jgi:hypothetical protein
MRRWARGWTARTAGTAALLVTACAKQAAADETPKPEPQHWYGGQTLLVDGAWMVTSTAAIAVAAESASNGTANSNLAAGAAVFGLVVAASGYTFGPPIVHWAHGHLGRGFADLAFRVGLPGVLFAIGASVQDRGEGVGVGVALGAVGVAGAVTIDAALIAYEDAPPPLAPDAPDASPTPSHASTRSPVSLAPMIAPRREGGIVVGISGTLF